MWARILIVAATVAAYFNTFGVPFLMDDDTSVLKNPSIRHLQDIGALVSPPAGMTTAGRPLLNITFAVNYALGGESVTGYHVVNLLVHVLAGLALYGIIRRTIAIRPVGSPLAGDLAFRSPASGAPTGRTVALIAALCWSVHPLLTESVTYISQRAESLMGLFYLLTLYCFIRGSTSSSRIPDAEHRIPDTEYRIPNRRAWFILSVASCYFGAATKETMVTAPVLILLYDRVFVSGSFGEALRRHRLYYCGLAATWTLLAGLIAGASFHDRGVGASAEITPWIYALTEFNVVVRYLGLAIWPHPLVFDYGPSIFLSDFNAAVPWVVIVVTLLAATAIAWRRAPSISFLGCAFFLLLAPTSSVVPVTFQPMAESRMYLPLAAVVIGLALLAARLGSRWILVFGGTAAAVLMALTVRRNSDYATEQGIWEDNLAKQQGNWRAHYSLALLYMNMPGRIDDALAQFESTTALRPDHADAQSNVAGLLLTKPGRLSESISRAEMALRLNPNHAYAHANLGLALLRVPGREYDALGHLEASVRLQPDDVEARSTLAHALADASPPRLNEALVQYEAAIRLNPQSKEIRNDYAFALSRSGRKADAVRELQTALRIDPNYADARSNLDRITKQ